MTCLSSTDTISFSELSRAAYCPRQLYYARRSETGERPARHRSIRRLSHRYRELVDATTASLSQLPIDPAPGEYRRRLETVRENDPQLWSALCDPLSTGVLLETEACRGRIEKVVGDKLPVHVSAGRPPSNGVWRTDAVRVVAACLALRTAKASPSPAGFVEYPRVGRIRAVQWSPRRLELYRRTVSAAQPSETPPVRTSNEAKCEACGYRGTCGVRTRTLRTRL